MRLDDKKFPNAAGYRDRHDRIDELASDDRLPETAKSSTIDRATIELRQRLRAMEQRAAKAEEQLEEELNQDTSDVLRYSVSVDVERPRLSTLGE